jgi:hypothetical protein
MVMLAYSREFALGQDQQRSETFGLGDAVCLAVLVTEHVREQQRPRCGQLGGVRSTESQGTIAPGGCANCDSAVGNNT